MRCSKILVCVHIYYHNQVDYIIEKLKNIKGFDYDIFVTYSEEKQETLDKFLKFDQNTKFLLTENRGYDIYPFLVLINQVNLDEYYCVLKLHTKNYDKNNSYSWRDDLYENLLGSKTIFKNNVNKLKKYGLVASKNWILEMADNVPENTYLFKKVCDLIGLKPTRHSYVAGTIFLAKIEIIKKIKELNLLSLDFGNKIMFTGSNGTISHVIERLFGILCFQLGFSIYGSNQTRLFSKKWFKAFIRSIFSIYNIDTFKCYKLLGITLKKNRYLYNINGTGNKICVKDSSQIFALKSKKIIGVEFIINGNNNTILIDKNAKFKNSKIEIFANGCAIDINSEHLVSNLSVKFEKSNYQSLVIDKNAQISNLEIVSDEEDILIEVKEGKISNNSAKIEKFIDEENRSRVSISC